MTIATTMSLLIQKQTPLLPAGTTSMPTTESSSDVEACRLTAAVARGDEAAFRQLYDTYQQRLFRFALVLGRGDETLASETVQSVFLTAAGKLRPVDSEEHLWNWLARVARQNLAKHWRQRQRENSMVSVAELPGCADDTQSDTLLEESLDAALLEMEADEGQVIEWFYLDGLSQKEIADRLNITPKAVSSRLERARAKLRQLVAKKLAHET